MHLPFSEIGGNDVLGPFQDIYEIREELKNILECLRLGVKDIVFPAMRFRFVWEKVIRGG